MNSYVGIRYRRKQASVIQPLLDEVKQRLQPGEDIFTLSGRREAHFDITAPTKAMAKARVVEFMKLAKSLGIGTHWLHFWRRGRVSISMWESYAA